MATQPPSSGVVGAAVPTLRDFAFIADGERGALVGPSGDIAWMCAPAWHDEAVFSSLIGGGGSYSVTPNGRYTWGGQYEDGSLIWHSRWVAGQAIIESCEALALPSYTSCAVVLRQIRALRGNAALLVVLDVRGSFGKRSMRSLRRDDDGRWTARTGDLRLRWTGGSDAVVDDNGRLTMLIEVPHGGSHDLVLEISDQPLPKPRDPAQLWASTRAGWNGRVPDLRASAAPRDARLATAVLHGLTSGGGGMVAAATMSLPERADRHRSYDYRYAWIRDQCYAGIAAAAGGVDDLLDAAVGFVQERVLADGANLRPAYRVNGGPVPDERPLTLAGYPGGTDIAGNWVNGQFQLDALGDVLRLLSAAARADRLDTDGWRAIEITSNTIAARWDEPDAGIWELDAKWWTHSRLAAVAGLRQAATIAPGPHGSGAMITLADAIMARTTRTCLHPDGYWQRSPDLSGVDASLVWPAVCGALPADDPRTIATLEAVTRDLTDDHYAYRYQVNDLPLGQAEGAFLLCGFMVSLAYHQQNYPVNAMRWFDRNRAACGSPGLLTEETDVGQRQLRGNLPQAFVHAALLNAAVALT